MVQSVSNVLYLDDRTGRVYKDGNLLDLNLGLNVDKVPEGLNLNFTWNGGIVPPSFQQFLTNLIEKEESKLGVTTAAPTTVA